MTILEQHSRYENQKEKNAETNRGSDDIKFGKFLGKVDGVDEYHGAGDDEMDEKCYG